MEKKKQLTRQELYELVWSKPSSQLGPEFGFSDVMVKKICRKYNIPKPGVGYWAQLKQGIVLQRAPLPGNIDEIVFLADKPPILKNPNGQNTDAGVIVRSELFDMHPLVEVTYSILKKAGINTFGDCVSNQKCLSIQVSPPALDRSLRIMDALIKSFELRGVAVSIDSKSQKTVVKILDESIFISLVEGREVAGRSTHHTGELTISLSSEYGHGFRRNWSDSKSRGLEKSLNAFINGCWNAAEITKNERIAREEREKAWREKEERREAAERRREVEESRIKNLRTTVLLWERYNNIISLITEVERAATQLPDNGVMDWIHWARGYANSINPVHQILNSSDCLNERDFWASLEDASETRGYSSYSSSHSENYWAKKWWQKR